MLSAREHLANVMKRVVLGELAVVSFDQLQHTTPQRDIVAPQAKGRKVEKVSGRIVAGPEILPDTFSSLFFS